MNKNIGLLVLISFIIISCKDDTTTSSIKKKDVDVENVVENVVNDEENVMSSFTSRKYSNDLVEEIYQEILNRDKELSKLDNRIKDLNNRSNEVIDVYNTVLSKSENYYTTALSKTEQFSDSLLAQKIDSLIEHSADAYSFKTNELNSAIDSARSNQNRINDLYTAFKIKKSLSEIEKYQKTTTFDLTNINNALKEQNKLIEEIKNKK